jgi:S1-C subfamily serine protease
MLIGILLLGTTDWKVASARDKISKSSSGKPIKDADVTAFLNEADKAWTPESAMAALRAYRAENDLTPKQEERLQKQGDRYAQYQREGRRRHGGKWRTSPEIKEFETGAEKFIQLAFNELKANNPKKSLDYFNRASSADPGGIRADFIVGMLYCLRGSTNPKLAAERFETVLKRVPDYGPARNNLAICEIKLLTTKKFGDAFANFRKAAELMPNSVEVLQNVNRVVQEADQGQLPLPITDKNKPDEGKRYAKFAELAAQLNERAAKRNQKFSPRVGWMYTPFMELKQAEPEPDRPQQPVPVEDENPLIPVAMGTGFLIAPGYLITNKHVVTDEALGVADRVTIRRPDAPPADLPTTAEIVALAFEDDLALLHAPDIAGTAIPLVEKPVSRGREILVLGYPHIELLGATLKTTRGVVTGLPDGQRFEGMLMMDAEANPGNSGGPVCDRAGRVVGVVTQILVSRTMDYSLAIPAGNVSAFVTQQKVDLPVFEPEEDVTDWSLIDERVSPAVYLIETSYRASPLRFKELLPEGLRPVRSEFEDDSCSHCSGRGHKACPAPGCVAGANMTLEYDAPILRLPGGDSRVITGGNLKVTKCGLCSGKGRIECKVCRGKGIDPDLR